LLYLRIVPTGPAPLADGTYRLYHVSLTQDRWVYALAGRFEFSSGRVALLCDPTGLLAQHLAPGPLTPAKRYFLVSLMTGSYRESCASSPGSGTCSVRRSPCRRPTSVVRPEHYDIFGLGCSEAPRRHRS
jgi:hypothetical protein